MPAFQSPRGTRDILPADQLAWQRVKDVATHIANQMGYQPITVPTYEELGLFQRAIGSGTDVIDKELFVVGSKSSKEETAKYALRPEGTAGIVRAFIEHGMHTWPQPVKLFTFVNNFRYDRPQKGRYREHVQFDIEYFGDTGPFADAWVIYTTWQLLKGLGLSGTELKLNSLGTKDERKEYIQALVEYFTPFQDQLSQDSQSRLQQNPLRILDSKDEADRKLAEAAPKLADFYTEESKAHFASVQNYLQKWQIPFVIDSFLVRGLDYYSHTAFEWTLTSSQGQQDSLGGGGRYDGLITELGGPDVGGVGAGLGLDRIVEAMETQGLLTELRAFSPQVYIIPADAEGLEAAPTLINTLLEAGVSLDANLSKDNVGNQMKSAARRNSAFAIIIGKAELDENEVTLKNLSTGEQNRVKQNELISLLKNG